ncbi:theg spermatid protein [Alosa alosa]|uniref:theg spermatid protein n=1 Tax=Alosa alosa TaxID=278164 RepID=UPI0020151E91|nr:theg spermatid protein [Alosa alosa]XP_048099896.1 theg spermatid protein [Alosa alosa]XP_048099903.1 theg spermatid protein [Alosa alosa]
MATRIDRLAEPKPNLLRFPDRRSVYWLDKLPPQRSGPTNFELSKRWSKLTEGKQIHSKFEQSRRSAEWCVSAAALKALPSDRVCSLALPRLPAVGWQPDRPLLAKLSVAKMAVASPRICELAQPKLGSLPPPLDHPGNGTPLTSASSRIHLLAAPKNDHPQYLPDRPVSWPPSATACEAVASERLQELSQPKPRRGLFEGDNPYTVSPAARAASASPRTQELSLPLARKCRKT